MSQELRTVTINLKSMDQDIPDPIVAGAGDADGRTFRIIFDQEAEAQLTPYTKVYLSWSHKQKQIKGYNVFTQVNENPIIWEIKWPRNMLHEGDVLCCIELVDDISIVQSTNFLVHVLSDPNDGSHFVVSDDYSIFQQAVIQMNSLMEKATEQLEQQKSEFDQMKNDFGEMQEKVDTAYDNSIKAYELAQEALEQISEKETAKGVFLIEY